MNKPDDKIINKTLIGVVAGGLLLYFLLRRSDQSGGTSDQNIEYNVKRLTFSPFQYKVFADTIETAIFGAYAIPTPWEDDETVARILQEMQNNDDVKALIDAYGRRYVGIFIQDGGNLVQTVAEYLDNDLIQQVNNNYAKKGIDIRF